MVMIFVPHGRDTSNDIVCLTNKEMQQKYSDGLEAGQFLSEYWVIPATLILILLILSVSKDVMKEMRRKPHPHCRGLNIKIGN